MAETGQLQFDAETHTYTVDGRVYPSVTQIIKAAGIIDDTRFNEEATNRGTLIHYATAMYDLGKLDEAGVPDDVRPYLEGWERFLRETKCEIVSVEKRVYHPTWEYAGTLDREVRLHHRDGLLDIKSGTPQAWHTVQSAGYAIASGRYCKRYGVYLDANGGYKLESHDDDPGDQRLFMSALAIFQFKQSKGLL